MLKFTDFVCELGEELLYCAGPALPRSEYLPPPLRVVQETE